MKLLFDFFPVLLFFLAFKLYGIFTATAVAIAASVVQVVVYWLKHRRFETMHLLTLGLIIVLGGATLFFHNELFIKWKPTAIYWASALVFWGSQWFAKKPLIQTMMEKNIQLPRRIWFRLNMAWAGFFLAMGVINIYVALQYDTNTWVNFKFFGGLGLTIGFVVLQAVYLSKHVIEDTKEIPSNSDT